LTDTITEPFNAPAFVSHESDGLHGGDHHVYKFANGYGASVIRNGFSYGGRAGLWELAVLDDEGHLTYSTPITDDVIGHLEPQDVTALLVRIAAL
jgi:hypothetical protein